MDIRTLDLDGLAVILVDAVDDLPADQGDFALVTGAHGGLDSARKVLRRPPLLAVFSDAGVGKDRAGIAGLELLDAFHIPAAAVDVATARIGDAADTLEHGMISHCNERAAGLGIKVGQGVREALRRLQQ